MADISRSDVSTLIQEAYNNTLLDAAVTTSVVLQAFPTVNLGTKTTHLPVLATLPTAEWVAEASTGGTGAKPTSEVTWTDRTMVVEEIAVIIPVHEDVLADATENVLTEIATRGGEAIGEVLDAAVLFGTSKPASWVSDSLFEAADSATQTVTNVTGDANTADLVGAVNTSARTLADLGLVPDTLIAPLTFRYDVENIRDSLGAPIFRNESFAGFQTYFNRNSAWDSDSASLLVADSRRIRIGVRQDIQVKILDQASIAVGEATINLAQRDMVAVRMKARYAYVLGISTTRRGTNVVPVAAVVPSGS